MRIGTWNVEYGLGVQNPDRLALLKSHSADIWVLTETHRDLDLSGTHISICSQPRPGQPEGSSWVTIWSQFPLVRCLSVPDPRRMVAALFDTPGGSLAVAGVVLPWHCDRGDQPVDPPPKNWAEHLRVLGEQVPALLQALRVGARRVLAGDFNTALARPHWYGTNEGRVILTELLAEEKLVCHTAEVLDPLSSPPGTLIDHVCTDLGRAETVETWSGVDETQPRLSDHPGVVVSWLDANGRNPTAVELAPPKEKGVRLGFLELSFKGAFLVGNLT